MKSIAFRLALLVAFYIVLRRSFRNRPHLSSGLKIRHTLILTIFVICDGEVWAGWTLGRLAAGNLPSSIQTYFGPIGSLPPWLLVPLWITSVTIGVVTLLLILSLADCRTTARTLLLRIYPLIVIADAFRFYVDFRGRSSLPGGMSELTVGFLSLGVFAIVLGWFYVWTYRFYSSHFSDPLFESPATSP